MQAHGDAIERKHHVTSGGKQPSVRLQVQVQERAVLLLQLLEVVDKLPSALDQSTPSDLAFLDFSKAFDKVPQERLLVKLEAYSVGGKSLKWLSSFLTGRKQRLSVENSTSQWKLVTSGVPQGSVLGPVLFTVYINDMPDRVHSLIQLFANDTKVGRVIHCMEDSTALQADMNSLRDCSE